MAMACTAVVPLSSSSTFLVSDSRLSLASQASSSSRSFAWRKVLDIRCAVESDEKPYSRREALSLATLSFWLSVSDRAEARNVPLFGFKKKLEQAEKVVESDLKELAKGGKELLKESEKEVKGAEAAIKEAVVEISSVSVGLSPTLQAGGVVGAELVAVLVASSVVNSLISVPSK